MSSNFIVFNSIFFTSVRPNARQIICWQVCQLEIFTVPVLAENFLIFSEGSGEFQEISSVVLVF